jgi:hypothetical protein
LHHPILFIEDAGSRLRSTNVIVVKQLPFGDALGILVS